MIGRLVRAVGRRVALAELDRIDAEVARWFVNDGQLSTWPLDAATPEIAAEQPHRVELRERRLAAVRRLQRWGGQDPWSAVLRLPSERQRSGYRGQW